jgi:hypothetical protein
VSSISLLLSVEDAQLVVRALRASAAHAKRDSRSHDDARRLERLVGHIEVDLKALRPVGRGGYR